MKSKIINVFAVCLITLTMLSPSLIIFGMVWKQHLNFVARQQNINPLTQTVKSEDSKFNLQQNLLNNSSFAELYLNKNATNVNLSNKYRIRHLWRWLFLFVPFCMVVAIYLYDRYLVYRAHVFQQQVEMLEKLWQQSLEK
jgi:hypothetical protein